MFGQFLLAWLFVQCYSERIKFGEKPPPCYQDISKIGEDLCKDFSDQVKKCGVVYTRKTSPYVVGGTEAYPGSWPWMVMLRVKGVKLCAGSILNRNWVLTAAHCFDYVQLQNASVWTVTSAKHHSNCTDTTEQEWPVASIVIHPLYVASTNENDIALIKLSTPLQYNCRSQPVCLPDDRTPLKVGRMCKIAGWGMTFGKGSSTALNELSLPVMDGSLCGSPEFYGSRYFHNKMVCLGYPQGGVDACNGDSGGPMVCQKDGTWVLSGVTSWGIGCAQAKRPGVYTRVRPFMPWIKQHLNVKDTDIIG
ncbi:serine protease hepsin-like [Argonauta hians]